MRARKFGAIILVCLSIGSRPLGQQALPEKETSKAFTVLQYCLQISRVERDKIWPGFDFDKYAVIVPDSESGTYIIGFSNKLDKSTNVPNTVLTGKFVAVVGTESLNKSFEEVISVVIHEAFHAFESDEQREGANWRRENSRLIFEYPDISAENNALMNTEGAILLSALQTDNKKVLRRKAQEFIAVRKLRQSKLESRMVEFETNAESNEGLAEYAGTKAVLVGIEAVKQKHLVIPFQFLNGNDYVFDKFEKLNTISRVGKNSRVRFYYTGSAQGLLLDHLMPGWKMRVQANAEKLQDLVGEAAESAGASASNLAEKALRQYGYRARLKEEEEFTSKKRAERQEMLESILNEKGRRYTIDASAFDRLGNIQSFDPQNVTVITQQKRIHKWNLRVIEAGAYKAIFKQPVIEDLEHTQYITVVRPDQTQEVLVDGTPLDLTKPINQGFSKLKITTPKFEFEASSGTITVTENGVLVKVAKR